MTRVSFSRVSLFERCGLAYYYAYLTDLQRPTRGAGLARGGALADTFNWFFGARLEGAEPSKDQLLQAGRDTLVRSYDGVDMTHRLNANAETLDESVDAATKLLDLWFDEVAPELKVAAVEEAVEIPIPDWDVTLVGRLDLRLEDDTVQDAKWRGKAPAAEEASRANQLTMYAMPQLAAARAAGDLEAEVPVRLDVFVRSKTITRITTQHSSRSYADVERVLRRVGTFKEALEAEVFIPAPEFAWWCGVASCDWWDVCPYGDAATKRGGSTFTHERKGG